MTYYGKNKPKAIITHKNYWDVYLEGSYDHKYYDTEAEAKAGAAEWVAQATEKWEDQNSAVTKDREMKDRFYNEMQKLLADLKADATYATKHSDISRSETYKAIAARIRRSMNKMEDD